MISNFLKENSSFRDPSGFLFFENNVLYRQINKSYEKDFHELMTSGLYDELVSNHFMVSHKDAPEISLKSSNGYKIIQPEKIDFVSYPYEWSFSQFKDAALLTLEIQKIALKYGMVLKDASAYNIQFKNNSPIFVDTLSFEKYLEGQPWTAYGQFCRHFVSPIALMTQKDIRLQQLLRIYIDGIPLDLTSKLLPMKTFTMFSLISHIHAHSKAEKKYSADIKAPKQIFMKRRSFEGLIVSLYSGIKKSRLKLNETEWGDYYNDTNYSDNSFDEKKKLVKKFIELTHPKTVWDLGANTGVFSKIASEIALNVISFDIDPLAIEKNYLFLKQNNIENVLPLLMDLANPSGGIGWGNNERKSLIERKPADLVLSLALIHHLVISNNVPLDKLSEFFHKLTKNLIIEFIPKEDSQISRLLTTRKDIFYDYDKTHFETEFSKKFKILDAVSIPETLRTLYLMEKI
jgi:ribosomal protein L11 methylase PrmA